MGDRLAGGAGDDTYYLWDSLSTITEGANQGIDTVYIQYWGGAKLADNVENMFLVSPGANWGTGNALSNVIVIGDTGATVDGGAGDDVLVGGKGADLFKVSAGNGSDAIYNFTPGWDVVKLDGYGIASFSQVLSQAKQVGADVDIKLSSSEHLVLRGVTLSSLSAADFNLPMTPAADTRANVITMTGANAAWNSNGWYVNNNAYNLTGLKYGTDASVTSKFTLADMTDGTTFAWSYPVVTNVTSTILAYPEIIFGISPLNPTGSNPTDTKHVFPARVGDLDKLTAAQDLTFSGNLGGFNVAYDIWLTSKAGGDKSTITNEVMIWVHKGGFEASGSLVGTYVSPEGATAKIYHTGTYTAVVFDQDMPKGTVDIGGIFAALTKLGIVSPNEYVGSVELGAEVVSGSGTLKINNLDLTVTTHDAAGNITTKLVTGTGTTVQTQAVPLFTNPFAAGTEVLYDPSGKVAGSKQTTIAADGTVKIAMLDALGKKIGSDVVHVSSDRIQTDHYDSRGAATGTDLKIYSADKSYTVQHLTAQGTLIGADRVSTDASGWTVTQHLDGQWRQTGYDRSITQNGQTSIQHYGANYALASADLVNTMPDGSVRTQHFDAAWKLTGVDVVATTATSVTATHYDGAWNKIGVDTTLLSAAGPTTYHYNAKGAVQTIETTRTDASGIQTTTLTDAQNATLAITRVGTDGADTLTATAKANGLHGGLGSDTYVLGSGVDTVYFDTAIGQGDVDTIKGFTAGSDKIALSHSIFAALGMGALDPGAFAVGTAATKATDHILYDKVHGDLLYDPDGIGGQAAIVFAHIGVTGTLAASDFLVT